jgi:hypothetical protein
MNSSINTYRAKRASRLAVLGIIVLVLTGVSGAGSEDTNVAPAAACTYRISGTWQWEELNISVVPGFVAGLIGLEDEGPTLHLTCESGGTMSFTQDGNTFSGSATQGGECITQGGQGPFYPFPSSLAITNGEITGRSIRFQFGTCTYRGRLVVDHNCSVLAIAATGNCPEVFTPASLKTVSFTAIR